MRGFARYLHAQGIAFGDSSVINADLTIEGGTQGFLRMLASGQRFDGIFCVNDLCALGAIEAAEKNGYRVGRDIAVMGIDNLEIAGVSRISLTSIDQPYDRIIVTAAAPDVPPSLTAQLADGGILVIPVGPVGMQQLMVLGKHAGRTEGKSVCDCIFVRLIGKEGYAESS